MLHETVDSPTDSIGHTLHQALRIASVVILQIDTWLSFKLPDIESQAEFRNVQLQGFYLQRSTLALVVAEHTHLIGKHNLCRQVVVSGNLCKGIVFVSQRRIKVLTGLLDKFEDTLLIDMSTKCKGVDEHADGVANTQVATASANRGDTEAFVVRKTRQGIEYSGQCEVGCGNLMFTTEGIDGIHVNE